MFWDNFYQLCESHGKKPNPVAKSLGFSSASVTKWKNGTLPNLSAVIDIAEYFHVTVDELLYGLPCKCYRCGYDKNPSNATFCKVCGNILHNNFCSNPDCDADGRTPDGSQTLLSDDCEYCPYCGSESTYKQEGLFKNQPTSFISDEDAEWLSLIHQLPTEALYEFRGEIKGYLRRYEHESVAAEQPIRKAK